MKPTYTNRPVNTAARTEKAEGAPPVGILLFMTFVLASMFFIRGILPAGGSSGETEAEEAAYVYGEFAEDTSNDDEEDKEPEEADTAGQTEASEETGIAGSTAYILPLIHNKTKPVSVFPLDGEITSYFGTRSDPFGSDSVETHLGIDVAGGTDIYACADGQVEKVGESDSYGNYVIIRHSGKLESLYAHCEKIYVSEGDTVSAGDVIAKAGKTGNATGVHLHFEIRVNGERVDPLDYVIYREKGEGRRG